MLMNHDFQGEIFIAEVGRVPDYWQYTGANRNSFNERTSERGKRRQVIILRKAEVKHT